MTTVALPLEKRRLPIGAELRTGGAHFRVWAPRRRRVAVIVLGMPGDRNNPVAVELEPEANGYFAGAVPGARGGMLYQYRLDDDPRYYPDPASRFQPEGPSGPSMLIDPAAFAWTDQHWRGAALPGQVIYEMHVGTFTPQGTWEAAAAELPELADCGITSVAIMPVADFPGNFGWGYDGVCLFAPTRLYGTPDDFRRFVDRAHAAGLGVILDVVYNHLAPAENYLLEFSPHYASRRYQSDWGQAVNFDGESSTPVREFVLANVRCWIDEFHLDGFRIDATQALFDSSPRHILADIVATARQAAGGRHLLIVGENESQQARLARPQHQGGHGLDALWNDDFHHAAMVALTGHNEGYYSDYFGTAGELLAAIKWGYIYQGQRSRWQNKPRGTPAWDLPAAAFVNYLQNHDQLANSLTGQRIHQRTSPGRYRAMTALWLLGPATPWFFQGQEFAASSPFFYFAEPGNELAESVKAGRAKFLAQFPSLSAAAVQAELPDPTDPRTFLRSKLDFDDRWRNAPSYALHRDLLKLRREDPVFRSQDARKLEGTILSPQCLVLRWFEAQADRLVVVNLGRDLRLWPVPQPLLSPPPGGRWELLWSSEDARYGGSGTPPLETHEGWQIPGEATVVLSALLEPQINA